MYGALDARLELVPHGKQNQVGEAHAVHRRDKGDGNAMADALDIVEMLHDLDQTEHRSDDADRRGITAGGLEHLGFGFPTPLGNFDFEFHHAPQVLQIHAVDREQERLAEKRIGQFFHLAFERHDPGAARLPRKLEW